jgi:hypothetical protein
MRLSKKAKAPATKNINLTVLLGKMPSPISVNIKNAIANAIINNPPAIFFNTIL